MPEFGTPAFGNEAKDRTEGFLPTLPLETRDTIHVLRQMEQGNVLKGLVIKKQVPKKEAKETIRGGVWVRGTNMITSTDRWWNKAEF